MINPIFNKKKQPNNTQKEYFKKQKEKNINNNKKEKIEKSSRFFLIKKSNNILNDVQKCQIKKGFFSNLQDKFFKSKKNFGLSLSNFFHSKTINNRFFNDLEEQLLISDVGVHTTRKLINILTLYAKNKRLQNTRELCNKLKLEMSLILSNIDCPLNFYDKTPYVILIVGINGAGKTTTIGKLAHQFKTKSKSVILAAGDTFRAGAVEQLKILGERNHVPVIAQHTGADAASVIFDAFKSTKSRNIDILIADTAGRLQNQKNLMDELKKIILVMKKIDATAPHEIMLILDATTGQNAINQIEVFNKAINITGITLTKLDGTAKGGFIFSIADQFKIPIRYIGIGENYKDLQAFNSNSFIETIFSNKFN